MIVEPMFLSIVSHKRRNNLKHDTPIKDASIYYWVEVKKKLL